MLDDDWCLGTTAPADDEPVTEEEGTVAEAEQRRQRRWVRFRRQG